MDQNDQPIQGLQIPHTLQQEQKSINSVIKNDSFSGIQFWGLCLDDLHLQVPSSTFQCKIDRLVSAIKPDWEENIIRPGPRGF
jgi:hypothetical protein